MPNNRAANSLAAQRYVRRRRAAAIATAALPVLRDHRRATDRAIAALELLQTARKKVIPIAA